MGWLQQFRMRRAARQYAALLGPHLQRAYGASEFYGPAQILASIGRLHLDERFVALGYASFLPEEDYAKLTQLIPVPLDYGEARSLFQRYQPPARVSPGHHYESGLGVPPGNSGGGGAS